MNERAVEDMLNPELDAKALSKEFAVRGRIRINDVLRPEFAEQAARCMEGDQVPWQMVFRRGKESCNLTRPEWDAMSREEKGQLFAGINRQAAAAFQYFYSRYDLALAVEEGRDPHLFLFNLALFLGSEYFLPFGRVVTRISEINSINAQATRYTGGNFLTRHDDSHEAPDRRCAYVMGFTRDWKPEWGGALLVLNSEGELVESYVPRFNSLVMFKVPMAHCVTYVAPFAQQPRHSVTGWLSATDENEEKKQLER